MHNPSVAHFVALKRILWYIEGTLSYGMYFKQAPTFSLNAYSDEDWAGDPCNQHSTTGVFVFLDPNPFSWSAKKQNMVARSSTVAEYCSFARTAAEISMVCYWKNSGFLS